MVVEFESFQDNAVEWVWTFEGGTPATSTEANPSVQYNSSGIYDVALTVVTSSGATFETLSPNFVTVNAAPVANFSFNSNGAQVLFTDNSTGGGSIEWDFGDMSATSTVPNPVHTYTEVGVFTVTQTVTNECGSSSTELLVEVLAVPPTASFSSTGTGGCTPFTIEFTDESAGSPTAWEWSFPGGTPASSTDQNPTVVYIEAGTYSVQLTVTNTAGESQAIQSQFIEIGASPTADFTFDINGDEVTFFNTSSGASAYDWQFGDAASSTSEDESPTFTYDGPGEYEVTLTVENECGSTAITQTITIEASSTVSLDDSAFVLTASPNPFAEQLLVNYELFVGFEKAEIQVFNVLGKQMTSVPVQAVSGTVSLENEITQSGVYFLQISVDGKRGKALRVVKL
jgi:PKD repeat protein